MSDSFLANLDEKITSEHLFTKEDRLLLACSGGLDSMVLLHSLRELGYMFEVAHVNYGLRGHSSDADAKFVADTCQALGLAFHLHEVDTFPTGNTQLWARRVRYNFFNRLKQQLGFDYLLVGHHLDDQIETFVLNFTRGTGVAGLAAMRIKARSIVRPLLHTRRMDIAAFAKQQKLNWRVDETNALDRYDRNKVRHHIIPPMIELRGHHTGMASTLQYLRTTQDWIEQQFAQRLDTYKREDGTHAIPWKTTDNSLELFERYQLLHQFGFNYDQVVQLSNSRQIGAYMKSDLYIAAVDRDELLVQMLVDEAPFSEQIQMDQVSDTITLPRNQRLSIEWVEGCAFIKSNETVAFDTEALHYPLTIRTWQKGDRFQPHGMYGKTKKVSDLLTHHKVSILDKPYIQVLEDAHGQILWVLGLRRALHAPITEDTSRMLRMTYS